MHRLIRSLAISATLLTFASTGVAQPAAVLGREGPPPPVPPLERVRQTLLGSCFVVDTYATEASELATRPQLEPRQSDRLIGYVEKVHAVGTEAVLLSRALLADSWSEAQAATAGAMLVELDFLVPFWYGEAPGNPADPGAPSPRLLVPWRDRARLIRQLVNVQRLMQTFRDECLDSRAGAPAGIGSPTTHVPAR